MPGCLAAHEKDLSDQCTHAFLWRYRVVQDCKEDIEKLCKQEAAANKLGQCFKEKQKDLSARCRSALAKGSKRHLAEDRPRADDQAAGKTKPK